MNIGIIICTYQRPDGKTPLYIKRCLDSINNQTYKNYKIFLIGDRYENNDEFLTFLALTNKEKLYSENLPFAHERDVYGNVKQALWCYAGTYATNYAMDLCLKEKRNYVCILNHDDYWLPNHLQEIYEAYQLTNAEFICTLSTYMNSVLPTIKPSTEKYLNFYPKPEGLIHSATCINIEKIPLRYKDRWISEKIAYPADAIYWTEVSEYMKQNNYKGVLINNLTCRHDEEGYIKK